MKIKAKTQNRQKKSGWELCKNHVQFKGANTCNSKKILKIFMQLHQVPLNEIDILFCKLEKKT